MPTKINDKLINYASVVEPNAIGQAERISRLPFVIGSALMADAHVGIAGPVGAVIATRGAVLPAAVGVDIGCGMIAIQTSLNARDLPDNMNKYLSQATRDIPAGVGQGHSEVTQEAARWGLDNPPPSVLSERQHRIAATQFGSLGSGNHFYEVCLDEEDTVWLMLHSGSRGIGNQLASMHIDKAKALAKQWFIQLEDPDCAYFVQHTSEFDAYIADMLWSQKYARANRDAMMNTALRGFFSFIGKGQEVDRINCHHNFCQLEHHHGQDLWVTRKGAIQARKDMLGLIPGSMGTGSYVVRGLGNPASFESCSHGAGRRMSRGQARREISLSSFNDAMNGVAWQSKDAADLVDEAPAAYKDLQTVMADQTDLVESVHRLKTIFNYKGVEKRSFDKRGRRR